jgi:hypothetical protein
MILENKMYVFGGGDGKNWLNDLITFDLGIFFKNLKELYSWFFLEV